MSKRRPLQAMLSRKRSRSSGALTSRDLVYRGGAAVSYPTQNYSGTISSVAQSGFLNTMNDIVTPRFTEVVKQQGSRVNNPMSSLKITKRPYMALSYLRSFSPNGWEEMSGPTVAWIFGDLFSNLPANPLVSRIDNLNRKATQEAWARVEPAKSQTLVTLLEAHKSWNTIYSLAQRLGRVVDACRRKDVRALKQMFPGVKKTQTKTVMVWDDDGRPLLDKRGNSRRYTKAYSFSDNRRYRDEASNLWLEYRYGISPIVFDMIDTLKAVYAADLRNELTKQDILTSRGRSGEEEEVQIALSASAGGLSYTGTRYASYSYDIRTYVHYRWSAPDGILRRLNDFGLFDVPKAIWEICPFSFIADWFIPIGEWLGALTPKIGVEILDVGHSARTDCVAYQTLTGFPSPTVGGRTYTPAAPLGSSDQVTFSSKVRETYLGIPYFPPIDVKLGIKRMVDVAALFRSKR